MMYAKEFQEAYCELISQTALLKGIYESLMALKQNEIGTTAALQQLFIKKLLPVGKYAFKGAFNMGHAKNWSMRIPVHDRAELWSEPFHLSISTQEEVLVISVVE